MKPGNKTEPDSSQPRGRPAAGRARPLPTIPGGLVPCEQLAGPGPGGSEAARGAVPGAGPVRGGTRGPDLPRSRAWRACRRRFTAQPISSADLARSFVFVLSSRCSPSQAFPFVVLENEENAISSWSPP